MSGILLCRIILSMRLGPLAFSFLCALPFLFAGFMTVSQTPQFWLLLCTGFQCLLTLRHLEWRHSRYVHHTHAWWNLALGLQQKASCVFFPLSTQLQINYIVQRKSVHHFISNFFFINGKPHLSNKLSSSSSSHVESTE